MVNSESTTAQTYRNRQCLSTLFIKQSMIYVHTGIRLLTKSDWLHTFPWCFLLLFHRTSKHYWPQAAGHASIWVYMADSLRHGADQWGQRYEQPKKSSLLWQTQMHTGGMLFYRPATTIHYSHLVLSWLRVNWMGLAGGNEGSPCQPALDITVAGSYIANQNTCILNNEWER